MMRPAELFNGVELTNGNAFATQVTSVINRLGDFKFHGLVTCEVMRQIKSKVRRLDVSVCEHKGRRGQKAESPAVTVVLPAPLCH